MKLYIYILFFVLLIIYITNQSNQLEKFSDDDTPNLYNVLQTDKVKPIQINANSNEISGFNIDDSSIYSDKYWSVKNKGFSDIYNYEDIGGEIIYNIATSLKGKPTKELSNVLIEDKIYNKITEETISNTISYKDTNYNLLGTAINDYYNQYFYIFENVVKQNITNLLVEEELRYMKTNNIFQYLLVKMENNKSKIIHWIGPRNKINLNDVVYLSFGTFQLGPLVINKI